MAEHKKGKYLTIIYPDELGEWLSGPDCVRDFVTGSDLIVQLGYAMSRESSRVLRHSDKQAKTFASRGAWSFMWQFVESVWYTRKVNSQDFDRADFDVREHRDYTIPFMHYLHDESMRDDDEKVRVQLAVWSDLDPEGPEFDAGERKWSKELDEHGMERLKVPEFIRTINGA